MPNPITAYKTARFIWDESKPVREWLWAKLPSVQDRKKRELVEDKLSALLDDSNDLAKALPDSDLEPRLKERIDQFRIDLSNAGLDAEDVALLADRATLFVRMLVIGPLGDVISLRKRLAEVEQSLAERDQRLEETERRMKRIEREQIDISEFVQKSRAQQNQGLIGLLVVFVLLCVYFVVSR